VAVKKEYNNIGTCFDIYYCEELILLTLKKMKKLIITSILAALVAIGTTVMAQDYPDEYLGLPGDNLNLYAVMKLFQESETLEGFERSLNDENSRINNLDLNGDNLIDYLTVSDYVDGDVHTIVLRAMLNRNESQDVAVFTVQRFRNGSAQIQLIGDEALYGRNYIIEPIYDDNNGETPNPGYIGRPAKRMNVTVVRTTPYEIAAWPLVRFIYLPGYVTWHSSWYWGYYPSYWHPWRPFYWHYYYGYHYNWNHHYYGHYRHWDNYRYTRYNDFYYSGIRANSPQVRTRIDEGHYKATYSHPEQRSEGEALYTRLNPGQNTRRPDNSSVDRREGRTVSESTRVRRTSGTSSGSDRRTPATVNERPVSKSSSDNNVNASRRPATTVNDKPVTKSSSDQNTGISRRSSPAVSDKTVSKSGQGQKIETTRTSRQSRTSVSPSSRRSSKETKTGTAVKKSEKAREAEDSQTPRRR
jgi:hypothetical protein